MPDIKRKFKRCKHDHVSGRRCAQSTSRMDQLCNLHKDRKACAECRAMMEAFKPPKGWVHT